MTSETAQRAVELRVAGHEGSESAASRHVWEDVGASESPSWYLDPVVARQKKDVNLNLLRRWIGSLKPRLILKTDLFEEANGEDQVLFELRNGARAIGMDISHSVASRARSRGLCEGNEFLVTDVRRLGIATGSVDVIFSNSTLDHFESEEEFDRSLAELIRVLRPGGVLVITLDNSQNPLYWLIRLAAKTPWAPFPMGYTTSLPGLVSRLKTAGLKVTGTAYLIHNPRLLSTALFLGLRRILGRRADRPIALLLKLFSLLDHLPSRRFTASFVAARAEKPADPASRA